MLQKTAGEEALQKAVEKEENKEEKRKRNVGQMLKYLIEQEHQIEKLWENTAQAAEDAGIDMDFEVMIIDEKLNDSNNRDLVVTLKVAGIRQKVESSGKSSADDSKKSNRN